jgi:hypothetical protein
MVLERDKKHEGITIRNVDERIVVVYLYSNVFLSSSPSLCTFLYAEGMAQRSDDKRRAFRRPRIVKNASHFNQLRTKFYFICFPGRLPFFNLNENHPFTSPSIAYSWLKRNCDIYHYHSQRNKY